jgi:hypothetical protein
MRSPSILRVKPSSRCVAKLDSFCLAKCSVVWDYANSRAIDKARLGPDPNPAFD